MSFVCVDIGASGSTRYTSNNGEVNELSNSYVHIPIGETSLVSIDTNDIESCLEVKITKNEPEQKTVDETKDVDFFPANVLVGVMAAKAGGTPERPSVQKAKYRQRNNFISAILACAVTKVKYDITEDIDLYVAVPPSETYGNTAENEFRARLVGTYNVEFPKYMGGVTVTFRIKDAKVYAESYMSATSYFFDMSGRIREQARNFMSGTVLSLDIGASTTDVSIVKQGRFLDSSGRTLHYGGNTAREHLSNALSIIEGIDFPIEDLDRAMAEGRLQDGNGWKDVSSLVNAAKQYLADALVAELENYFIRVKIPVKTINAIVVSGGGSLQSQYADGNGQIVKTAEPMSFFVTKKINTWSQNTVIASYGEDARYANIKGLYVRAKMDEIKAKQANTVSTQAPVQPQVPVQPQQTVQPQASVQQPVQQSEVAQTPVTPVAEQPVQ